MKRLFLLNVDNKPGRYTKTYSLLCYEFLKYLPKEKLAEYVGKEEDVGKAVSEGQECVPSAGSDLQCPREALAGCSPWSPWVIPSQAEGGSHEFEVCVWSMSRACHHPNVLLSCFVSLFPSVSLDVSPAPHPCWDGSILSWFSLCSSSLLLHPAGASLPRASVLFFPFVSYCCKLREMDDIYCKY